MYFLQWQMRAQFVILCNDPGVSTSGEHCFFEISFAIDPPPTKTRKPRVIRSYTSKPAPKVPNTKNRPTTSAQPYKQRLDRNLRLGRQTPFI